MVSQKLKLRAQLLLLKSRIHIKKKLTTGKLPNTLLFLTLFAFLGGYFFIGNGTYAADQQLGTLTGQTDSSDVFYSGATEGQIKTLVCRMIGGSGSSRIDCFPDEVATSSSTVTQYDGGGALGSLERASLSLMKEHPVDTGRYIASLMDKAGVGVPSTYAQGQEFEQGADYLVIIQKLWTLSRDTVNILFVIVFLIVGIMIIMRQRLGQVSISFLNSLPNIVVALVLVNFSYAISGLIIDAMNLVMQFLWVSIINSPRFITGDSFEGITKLQMQYWQPQVSVWRIFGIATVAPEGGVAVIDSAFGDAGGFGAWIAKATQTLLDLGFGFDGVVSLVLSIVALATMFKIFFTLLTNWVTLLLYPIIAPFAFLLGSFPGRSSLIFGWFKKMAATASVFVVIYGIFLLIIAMSAEAKTAGAENYWTPPLGGITISPQTVASFAAFGLFMFAPTVPPILERLFDAVGTSGFGQGVSQAGQDAGAGLQRVGRFIGVR